MDNLDLNEVLKEMSADELVQAVMEYASKDRTFAKDFLNFVETKLKFGGEMDAREEVNNSFCMIRPSRGHYDDSDWFGIMEESGELFKKALQALSYGNLNRAVTYPLQWLKCFSEGFTEEAFFYDDEGTEFSSACRVAMDIIEKVITNTKADAEFKEDVCSELSVIAESATVFDNYCFVNLKAFAKRMKAVIRPNQEALSIIDELINEEEYGVSLASLIIQKSTILVSMGKEQESLQFLENNVCETEVCQYLVKILTEKKDYDRTLKVLERALLIGEDYDKLQWLRKEIEIFELQGRSEDVINSYRRLFIASEGEFESYKALKKRIPSTEWKSFLKALMNETTFNSCCYLGGKNEKAEILIAENDFPGLLDYMCEVEDYDKLDFYEHYASQLPVDSQKKLMPYYMDAIRKEAESANKRDHYSRVRWHISNLKGLKGSGQSVAILLAEFRELYNRRPAFMDELTRV